MAETDFKKSPVAYLTTSGTVVCKACQQLKNKHQSQETVIHPMV